MSESMIGCGQCFFTIAQALAICSACAAPIIFSCKKIFNNNKHDPPKEPS